MAMESEIYKAILKAIGIYNNEYPGNDYPGAGQKSWLENAIYSRALDHEGRLYPPKKIWSLVTGERPADFNTKNGAERGLMEAGFRTIEKPGATRHRRGT